MSGGGEHGLGLLMAIIFLSGEMAGVGVLALPKSMVGTGRRCPLYPLSPCPVSGPAGFALILYFTINAMFSGSRLGLCWVMICERWEEYREGVCTAQFSTVHYITIQYSTNTGQYSTLNVMALNIPVSISVHGDR